MSRIRPEQISFFYPCSRNRYVISGGLSKAFFLFKMISASDVQNRANDVRNTDIVSDVWNMARKTPPYFRHHLLYLQHPFLLGANQNSTGVHPGEKMSEGVYPITWKKITLAGAHPGSQMHHGVQIHQLINFADYALGWNLHWGGINVFEDSLGI